MIKVMSNSSPIIGLSIIGQLRLLWEMFDVYIPCAVYNEIVCDKNDDDFGKRELENAVFIGAWHVSL